MNKRPWWECTTVVLVGCGAGGEEGEDTSALLHRCTCGASHKQQLLPWPVVQGAEQSRDHKFVQHRRLTSKDSS